MPFTAPATDLTPNACRHEVIALLGTAYLRYRAAAQAESAEPGEKDSGAAADSSLEPGAGSSAHGLQEESQS